MEDDVMGNALRPEYPMLGLVSEAFPYRVPGPRFGRYGSLVMVAPCNMACPYCDVGGYAKDKEHNLPGWRMISTSEIESFVDSEVADGRVVYFTGGEPLLFADLVAHLGQRVRDQGGYSVVCTNATMSRRLRQLSPHVDEFSVSLKGSPAIGARVAGVTGKLAFAVPYRNSGQLLDLPNLLELVVVLFDDLSVEDLRQIYEPFFARAYMTFKQYRPKVTTALDDHTYHTELLPNDRSDLRPMSLDRAVQVFDALVAAYPQHASHFSLVTGGGRDQTVRTSHREYVFLR
jgi:pyruvate-formate lyase-activating enzyme